MTETSTDSFTSLVVVSELAALLAIVLIVIFVLTYRKRNKKKKMTESFLTAVKNYEIERDKKLKEQFNKTTELTEEECNKLVDTLIEAEKTVYLHIAQLYMGYNPDSLMELEKEMQSLAECALTVYKQQHGAINDDSTSDEDIEENDTSLHDMKKQIKNLREEKKVLKEKNAQLQIDFDAAMDSMERMTTEFANMYEGGSKEGEKRVKNEMYQLRQTLAQKKEFTEADDEDDIPDLEAAAEDNSDIPDLDAVSEKKEDDGSAAS